MQSTREDDLRFQFRVLGERVNKPCDVSGCATPRAFGDVRRNRYGSLSRMEGESEAFVSRVFPRDRVYEFSEVHRFLPALKIAIADNVGHVRRRRMICADEKVTIMVDEPSAIPGRPTLVSTDYP